MHLLASDGDWQRYYQRARGSQCRRLRDQAGFGTDIRSGLQPADLPSLPACLPACARTIPAGSDKVSWLHHGHVTPIVELIPYDLRAGRAIDPRHRHRESVYRSRRAKPPGRRLGSRDRTVMDWRADNACAGSRMYRETTQTSSPPAAAGTPVTSRDHWGGGGAGRSIYIPPDCCAREPTARVIGSKVRRIAGLFRGSSSSS